MANIAVNLKFIWSLLFVQLLLSITCLATYVHAHQAVEVEAVSARKVEKQVDGAWDQNVATKAKIGGRKWVQRKHEIEGNGEAEESLKISSANQETGENEGNIGKKMKKQKVDINGGINMRRISHSHRKEMNDDSGFVAFNADYHAPRHHPPKNN